jgi:hypothetical protein
MTPFSITTDTSNRDILPGETPLEARERLLGMRAGFVSRLAPPVVTAHGDKWVFRGDLSQISLKGYAAEQLIAETPRDVLVYVVPRVGMAPNAIATLAQMYGKRCVFFTPACKELSVAQRSLLAQNVDLRFVRIVAMPTMNRYAKDWAEKHDAVYLPKGLSEIPLVTAGLVHTAQRIAEQIGSEPTEVWMAVSTGTAIRAFQIAWTGAKVRGLAVARGLVAGEIGHAKVRSASMPFLRKIKQSEWPPFASTAAYDAKCWREFEQYASPGAIFINVGSDKSLIDNAEKARDVVVDSWREWGDKSGLEV